MGKMNLTGLKGYWTNIENYFTDLKGYLNEKSKRFKRIEDVERLYKLLEECEKQEKFGGIEGLSKLQQVRSLYRNVFGDKGKIYCSEHLSDAPTRINGLADKLMEYDS